MADTGAPSYEHGLEARVAKLEADVAHMRGDIADIKSTLNRLAPTIDEMRGFLAAILPTLATKAELAEVRAELKSEIGELRTELKSEIGGLRTELKSEIGGLRTELAELRLEILLRPTRRQTVFDILAIVALIGAVLAIAARLTH